LIFFFAPDLRSALGLFPGLFHENQFVLDGVRPETFFLGVVLVVIFMTVEIIQNDTPKLSQRINSLWSGTNPGVKVFRWAIYFAAITMIIVLSNEVQEFIYFQF